MKTLRITFTPLLLLIAMTATSGTAMAQRTASELSLLEEASVREELGITGDSAEKMEAILKIAKPDTEFYKPYFDRIAEAGKKGDLTEKANIQKEMFTATAAKVAETKAKALTMLTASQKQKLRGIFLRSTGVRVFSDARVASEYGLSEEQVKQFAELASEYRTASRTLSDATDEDRDKFAADWKNKFLDGLSPEQKTRFDKESTYDQAPAVAPVVAAEPLAPQQMNQPPEGQQAEGSFGGGDTGDSKRVTEFRFNFRFESWERVLQMYADGAGLTLDLNQIPPGTFSHYDDNAYSQRQTLDILNGYLHRKGFAMVENDRFLIVMNTDNGIAPYLIRDVTEEQLLKLGTELEVGNNELANFRISVDGMDTAKVAQEVEAVLGPLGSLVALTDSQLLIITDVGANLRRIHGLLTAAMSKAKPDALMFAAYPLKNMDAEEAEIAVMTQFGMRQNVQNVSAAAEEQRRSQARTQAMSRIQTPPQRGGTPTPAGPAEPAIQIASDMRLNSLLVTGTTKQHELVKTILTALDVNEDASGNPLDRDRRGSYLEVYKVTSADAREVTKTLGAMNLPGVNVVNEDGDNGTIHIVATQRQHEEVAALIRQLDGGGISGSVAVIQLAQMDPLSAAATLRSLFYADGDEAPTIETDLYGRRLIVRGSVDQIAQIKQVLADLGEDGTGVRDRGDGGMVRRFSLQGRNPEEFLKVLQQQWESQQETKINIVIPNESSPIKSRRTPEEEFDRPIVEPPVLPEPATSPLSLSRRSTPSSSEPWSQWKQPAQRTLVTEIGRKARLTSAVQDATPDETADPEPAAPPAKKPWSPDGRGPANTTNSDVFIQLLGDDLILSATDEATLDELEDLLDFLHQSLPMKPEYTVVYLKAADALEAADMLSQFFPSSSVATTSLGASSSMLGSLGGSLGGMGSSLLDMTGLSGLGASSSTLKIIPDVRTNSLFMTGPQALIKDALVFLKVLDSNDIPESLKDMQPRQIAVKYADVNDVSTLLESVFKPYMEVAGGKQQQQQNPLAAMFGGGGGRGAAADPTSQVRLTLGIDSQTSTLTINSSQDVFDEVESVVLQMDEAAKTAKPTVLPIQLRNADATVIQQMLQGLMPRVSVSSSKTNTSRTGASNDSGGNSSGNADAAAKAQQAQQEAMRQAFQQRIQQQQQGGGGGGTRGGAGGGGGRPNGGGGRGR
jgi:type II secretory pathway component GspD/PulD (secretin)